MTKKSDAPAIRFKGFSDAWEQRKLGDVGETYTGLSGKTKADFGHGQARFVTYMNVFSNPISNPEMTEPIEIDPKQNEVEVGDVFFTTSSETPEEVGMSSVLLEKRGKIYLNSFCFGFRPTEKIDSYYLAYMLRSESAREKIILLAQGISRYNISKNKVMEIAVSLPSLDEQKLIGQYFRQLDNLITLHQRQPFLQSPPDISLIVQLTPPFYTFSWEQRKAIDIADYSKGNGYSKGDLTDAGTPIILYGRLYTKYQFAISEVDTFAVPRNGAVYSQGNEVIVPASGETAEDIARASAVEKSGVLLGGDLNILRPFDFINPLFLALAISNGEPQKELAKKAQGKSVVHIHNTDIQEVTIAYPSRTEQDRIVSVFRQLDNLITLHQRKCVFLFGFFQAFISMIFTASTFSWEQRKFGEITSKYEDPVPTPHDGYYRLGIRSHAKGTFHSYVAKGQELETAQMHRVAAGNFIVNITFGWEHAVAITDKNDAGKLVSHRFPQFSFAEGMVPEFFRYVIVDEKFRHHLWLASPGGAGRNRVLKLDEMLNYLMRFPSRDEQIKIAEFFRHLDNLITLHQRKYDKLTNVKKSMLEKMFPKNGSNVPEIRFKGFTEAWEQRKLGDVVQITMGQSPDGSTYSDEPSDYILVQGNADLQNGWVCPRIWTTQITKKADAGDLIMSVRAPAGAMGKTAYNAVIGRGVAAIKGNEFIYQLLVKMDTDGFWKTLSCGSTFESLNSDNIKNAEVKIPTTAEQIKIGGLFQYLDNLITLHQRELEKLKNLKKACLEKMFV